MSPLAAVHRLLKKAAPAAAARGMLARFGASREGVGAVEFALIVPILLIIYLMSFEITVAISMTRKVSHATSDVADLVTQKTTVDKTYLATMSNVAAAIMAPYSATNLTLKISGIAIDSTPTAKVQWSWQNNGTVPYTAGSTISIPSDLLIPNSFIVHAEMSLPYSLLLYLPGLSGTSTKSLTIKKDFYYRQRVGDSITCSNC